MKWDAWAVFWICFFLYEIVIQLYPHGIKP
jgi:hypothetical protein